MCSEDWVSTDYLLTRDLQVASSRQVSSVSRVPPTPPSPPDSSDTAIVIVDIVDSII